jgi:hypothetical protein
VLALEAPPAPPAQAERPRQRDQDERIYLAPDI